MLRAVSSLCSFVETLWLSLLTRRVPPQGIGWQGVVARASVLSLNCGAWAGKSRRKGPLQQCRGRMCTGWWDQYDGEVAVILPSCFDYGNPVFPHLRASRASGGVPCCIILPHNGKYR